jgi:hypothetical protein
MKSTVFSRLCLAVAVCQLLTFFLPFPWDYVLYAPWHYLLWAFISSGNLYCALALLTLYVVVQVLTRRKQQKSVTASADGVPVTEQSPPEVALVLKSKAFAVIACLALITILVGPFVVFGLASTVCEGSGLVNTVSATIENVVLSKAKQKHELADDATKKQRLEDLSKVVFAEGLLKCDMIVTATEAKRTHGEWSQPREKYFIAMTNENRKALLSDQDDPIKKLIRPEAYDRFTFLLDGDEVPTKRMTNSIRSNHLMDVIIGSGSVYPFFPGRQMDKNEASFLIDGSYVHHRPIEAAWLRGATHVLLVDPNPNSERQDPKPSFYSSLGLAVEQLFHQAQSINRPRCSG